VPHPAVFLDLVPSIERILMGSVAVTARALAEVAPDMSFLQWRAVVVVGDEPDGLAVSSLATRIGSKLPAASRLVARLRQRGIVATHRSATDARVTTVALTPEGHDLLDRVLERRRTELRAAVEAVDLDAGNDALVGQLALVFDHLA
jgi:DNA-binding MarR family transcriptional regulator